MRRSGFVFLIAAVVVLAGCTSVDHTTNRVGWSSYAEVAVKDYEPLGIVTLESQEVYIRGPLGINRSLKGTRIVWSDLMNEAAKLGADDIINVRIETNNLGESSIFDFITGYTVTFKHRATALAIKYKGAVERVKTEEGTGNTVPDFDPAGGF
ncbi:MAG: hypothetical protein LBU21_09925 [Treponema sp.]|jgi:hypothetical protein|nr:hypothetical protein [Treponema sp.]